MLTLQVSRRTLAKYADAGWIRCIRTPGTGTRRLYDTDSVRSPGGGQPVAKPSPGSATAIIYCRVSTHKQKASIERQERDNGARYTRTSAVELERRLPWLR